ncbi:ABC transporter substrate-binding protein [Puniceibacterium sediminis]|uniref:Thiamine pyrimidine synthase n=1 Tax=Puniceibacterium sediminis TaxID=1608407 RepID=A0A238WIA9_9RHOB|nr:ABC transporter substrate-binding protein [Puniceibacterium sediminis]SNR46061.1 putative hydroxymethylpyrimidine transport system substrate-binding protein [Puniceibacterium sediminis]
MKLTRRILLASAAIASAATLMAPAAMAQDLTKLTFIQEWPTPDGFWIPWIVGSDKGFYAEEGIELEIVTPPTVADTMKFLGTARAQVAFTTSMDIIFAKAEEAPVVAIGRYGRSNNWGILSPTGTPMNVADLKGKTVGIYNDAWTLAQLGMVLADAGMTINDIKTVAASDDTVPLLLQERVDAITGITNAEGTAIVTVTGEAGEFLPAIEHGAPNTPIFALAANTDWLADNPDLAKAFLRATSKSITYAVEHPEEAVEAFGTRYAKAYDPAFIHQQWLDTIPLFGDVDGTMLVNQSEDWDTLVAALDKFDVLDNLLPSSEYFTNAYLPE